MKALTKIVRGIEDRISSLEWSIDILRKAGLQHSAEADEERLDELLSLLEWIKEPGRAKKKRAAKQRRGRAR